MSPPSAHFPDAFRPLWSALESLLVAFDEIQNRLDPPRIPEYADRLKPFCAGLGAEIERAESAAGNEVEPAAALLRAANQALRAAEQFETAREGPHEILKAFQALRPLSRAREILFGLAHRVDDVGLYFIESTIRERTEIQFRLRDAVNGDHGGVQVGLMQTENPRGKRGGYSLYVPEDYTAERKWPLIVALHGGSGHGADFLWSWLPAARSMGFILSSPTSRDRTWSLRNPGVDASSLNAMLEKISGTYNINTERILLTGISDGGTYAMLLSVVHQAPFTHYAPVAAAVHALMDRDGRVRAPVRGKRIYQVHGARDWMFPVAHAREAAEALRAAGADLIYREIEELSHNYPRDENVHILQWFCPERGTPR